MSTFSQIQERFSLDRYAAETGGLWDASAPGYQALESLRQVYEIYPTYLNLKFVSLGTRDTLSFNDVNANPCIPVHFTPEEELIETYARQLAATIDLQTFEREMKHLVARGFIDANEGFFVVGAAKKAGSVAKVVSYLDDVVAGREKHPGLSQRESMATAEMGLTGLFAALMDFRQHDLGEIERTAAATLFSTKGIPVPESPRALHEQLALSQSSSLAMIAAAVKAGIEPGKYVVVPQGSFEYTSGIVEALNRRIAPVSTEKTEFLLTAEDLEKTIKQYGAADVKGLILTNPTNVLGLHYSAEELQKIGSVAIKYGLLVINDELFSGVDPTIYRGRPFTSLASLSAGSAENPISFHNHVVTIQGTSKITLSENAKLATAISGNTELMAKIRCIQDEWENLPSVSDTVAACERLNLLKDYGPSQQHQYNAAFDKFSASLDEVNRRLSRPIFSLLGPRHSGFFAGLSVDSDVLAPFGVRSSMHLTDYLGGTVGIFARPIDGMRIGRTAGKVTTRLNVSEFSAKCAGEFTERLAALGTLLINGGAPKLCEVTKYLDDLAPKARRK